MERRFFSDETCPVAIEKRGDGQPVIVGYAAVFHVPGDEGTEYQLFSDLKERIMPRAFNKALQERHDAVGLLNHDPNHVLGRVSAGTLKLAKDQRGLRYEITPPASRADVVESIQRGDIKGSSFGFRVLEQKFKTEDGMDVREIHSVELLDVSPVTFPAYKGTTAGMRAMGETDEIRSAYDAFKAEKVEAERAKRERLDAIVARAKEVCG